jgi:hypothetical protein
VQVVALVGKDLCNVCLQDFHIWVEAGSTKLKPRGGHDWWRRIRAASERFGRVTPDNLVEVFGCDRKGAHDALRFYKRTGRLTQCAESTYEVANQP